MGLADRDDSAKRTVQWDKSPGELQIDCRRSTANHLECRRNATSAEIS